MEKIYKLGMLEVNRVTLENHNFEIIVIANEDKFGRSPALIRQIDTTIPISRDLFNWGSEYQSVEDVYEYLITKASLKHLFICLIRDLGMIIQKKLKADGVAIHTYVLGTFQYKEDDISVLIDRLPQKPVEVFRGDAKAGPYGRRCIPVFMIFDCGIGDYKNAKNFEVEDLIGDSELVRGALSVYPSTQWALKQYDQYIRFNKIETITIENKN